MIVHARLWDELNRCDKEIAIIHAQALPNHMPHAWINALGHADWESEKVLIRKELIGMTPREYVLAAFRNLMPKPDPLDQLLNAFLDRAQAAMEALRDDVATIAEDQIRRLKPQPSPRLKLKPKPQAAKQAARSHRSPIRPPLLYDLLGVQPDAPQPVLDAAYKALARMYHPDMNKSKQAEDHMKRLNAAYAVLKQPATREQYNRSIGL